MYFSAHPTHTPIFCIPLNATSNINYCVVKKEATSFPVGPCNNLIANIKSKWQEMTEILEDLFSHAALAVGISFMLAAERSRWHLGKSCNNHVRKNKKIVARKSLKNDEDIFSLQTLLP